MGDEQVDAVGPKPGRRERAIVPQALTHVLDRLADLRQLHAVVASDHGKQVQLAQIDERQQAPALVGGLDDAGEELAAAVVPVVVVLPEAPGLHRSRRQAEDLRRLGRAVGGFLGEVWGSDVGGHGGTRSILGCRQCSEIGWRRDRASPLHPGEYGAASPAYAFASGAA